MQTMNSRYLLRYLPNAITLAAMCLGLTALRLSYIREDLKLSLLLLLIAAICDGIDGKIARKLNVQSPVGAQLDSLADFLNFCVTPALIIYEWHLKDLYFFGWAATLIFLTGGAYRLARFNVMHTGGAENISSHFFVGVPTPAGALLSFLPMVLMLEGYIQDQSAIFTACYMSCVAGLMVSYIKTPSTKFIHFKRDKIILILAVIAILALLIFIAPLTMYLITIISYIAVIAIFYVYDDVYHKNKRS
ncbi:MAG: phosphatidylcholine/phosphatidylserine synthase [Alphaproteobacteria bacterium]|nr:MAG: phosphatidylcholine/phosphatidylserine synthase [Alphaproteobacteria bacterium]